MYIRRFFMMLFIIIIFSASSQVAAQNAAPKPKLIGYYTSYSIYDAQYFVTDIPVQSLTHINYAYVGISSNGQCISSDPWADTGFSYPGDKPTEHIRGNFKQLQLLKKKYPDLQILMSIGGWEQSKYFSDVAATHESRIRFVNSCVSFMRTNGFDGIDVDWRYPVSGGMKSNIYRPEDRQNYTLLLAELRGQLDYWTNTDKKTYLLTATTPAIKPLYDNLDLQQIASYLDWLNLTTYGFQGDWSDIASHQAPLFSNKKDPRGEPMRNAYNVDGAINAYLDKGVPAEKIVLGIPLYGQAWQNVKANDDFGLYEPNQGIPSGTRPGGLLFYHDIVPLLNNAGYVQYFDDEAKAAWLYNPSTKIAISYENELSIKNKTLYARNKGLAGVMVWELSYDDKNTLLKAAYDGMTSKTEP